VGAQLLEFVRELLPQQWMLRRAAYKDIQAWGAYGEFLSGRFDKPMKGWWTPAAERRWREWMKVDIDAHERSAGGRISEYPRMRRLVGWYLSDYGYDPKEGPQTELLSAAIDEARREGTLVVVAPLLEDLHQAHEAFLQYSEVIAVNGLSDKVWKSPHMWSPVAPAIRDAVARIRLHLPPGSVRFDETVERERGWDPPIIWLDPRLASRCPR